MFEMFSEDVRLWLLDFDRDELRALLNTLAQEPIVVDAIETAYRKMTAN